MLETFPSTTLPPSGNELLARLAKVRALMTEQGFDALVCCDPVNVYYLTNFANIVHERPFLLVIKADGRPLMVAPLLELSHVRSRTRLELEYDSYSEFPAPAGDCWFDVLARHVPAGARVGIEPVAPVGIASKVPGRHVVADLVDEVRLVKTDYEIARTVHACAVIREGHEVLLDICRPGIPEITVWSDTVKGMMSRVLRDIPDANMIVTKLIAAVWPPSISHDPHLIPTPFTPMETGGPHVSIVSGQVNGVGVEVERTFFLGEVPERATVPFNAMMAARARAYELARPGAVLSEIDRSVRETIFRAGYGGNILHRTGHGLGITGHEAPFIAIGDDRVLREGMVMSIEPGIYIPGIGGFRHSDTVLITDQGPVSLTPEPESLEELTVAV